MSYKPILLNADEEHLITMATYFYLVYLANELDLAITNSDPGHKKYIDNLIKIAKEVLKKIE